VQRPVGEARLIRLLSEAGVVASEEAGQEAVCRLDVRDAGEGELDDQTVLEGAPEAFDPALCLGGVGGDGHDAELFQRPAELGRLPAALQLLVDGPGSRGVVLEDGMAVVVELQRDAVRPQHLSEEEEVALGVLLLAKECCYHLASGVVNGAEEADLGLVWAQPVVEAAVYLQEHSFLGSAVPMAAMSGWSALVLGLLSRLAAEALVRRVREIEGMIPATEKAIGEARHLGADVDEAARMLEKAKVALQRGEHVLAVELVQRAERSTMQSQHYQIQRAMELRLRQIERAQKLVNYLVPIADEAAGYDMPIEDVRRFLADARDVLDQGDYVNGTVLAKQAEERLRGIVPHLAEERLKRGITKPPAGRCGTCDSGDVAFLDDGWSRCNACGASWRWRAPSGLWERFRSLLRE